MRHARRLSSLPRNHEASVTGVSPRNHRGQERRAKPVRCCPGEAGGLYGPGAGEGWRCAAWAGDGHEDERAFLHHCPETGYGLVGQAPPDLGHRVAAHASGQGTEEHRGWPQHAADGAGDDARAHPAGDWKWNSLTSSRVRSISAASTSSQEPDLAASSKASQSARAAARDWYAARVTVMGVNFVPSPAGRPNFVTPAVMTAGDNVIDVAEQGAVTSATSGDMGSARLFRMILGPSPGVCLAVFAGSAAGPCLTARPAPRRTSAPWPRAPVLP